MAAIKGFFCFLWKHYPLSSLFTFYLVAVLSIYGSASNTLLIDDGMAGLIEFKKYGYAAWFNSYGFPSLYYTHDFAVLLVYAIAGKSPVGWFIVMAVFHSINAALSFKLFKLVYSVLGINHGATIAIAGSVLFLLSPYQTENVVWAATLHYSIVMLLLLLTGITIVNCLQKGVLKGKNILLIVVLHALAITSLEIALFFPAVYFVLGILLTGNKKTVISISEYLLKVILPLTILTGAYFVATYLLKGHWIPHYGSQHLENSSIAYYVSNAAKHTVKLLSYSHFTGYNKRELIYAFCERWKIMLLCFGIIISIGGILVWFRNRFAGLTTYAALVSMAFILLFPALNMYFMYLFNTENDRLSYFCSLVLYQCLSMVLISVSVYVGIALLVLFLSIGFFFLNQQVIKWNEAGTLHNNYVKSFTWLNAPKAYVLTAPANYKGVYQFRNRKRLYWAIHFFKDVNMEDRMHHIMYAAYAGKNDSSTVTLINDSTLNVELTTNGGWLMYEGKGANDYSTDEYTVTIDKWKPSYRIIFHNKIPGAVYIYAGNNAFKAVEGF